MERNKTRMTNYQQDMETLRLAWGMMFPFPVPDDCWLGLWLKYNPLSTVLSAFEFLADGQYESAAHLGKTITTTLRSVTYTT
jgi:hypothetical protein